MLFILYLKTVNYDRLHLHHHLKTVHMTGVFGFAGQLELAKYILSSAHGLEHMIIDTAMYLGCNIPIRF
jgi:hypothetical protein